MKKLLISVALICVLFVSGCGCNNNSKEAIMKKYADDYYDKFMKDYVIGNDVVEISIEMLENANKNAGTDYDLSKLDTCKKTSKIVFTLKTDSNKVSKTEYDLNCE